MYNTEQVPTKISYEELGLRIKNRRKELQIKQAKMAEDLNISNNHLSSIEHGRQKPSLDFFVRICSYLKVSPNYLLFGSIHSYNLPQNTLDKLKLCDPSDLYLANQIIELMVDRGHNKNDF